MKPCVMQLVVALRPGGAERLALDLLDTGRERFRGVLAGMFHTPGAPAGQARQKNISCLALRAERLSRLRAVWELYRALRRERATLLHVQAGYLLPYALPAAGAAGLPLVYTEHALHSLQTQPRLRFLVRLCGRAANAVTAVNPEVAGYFCDRLGFSPERVRVIPNGVDLKAFSPQGEKAAPPWPEKGRFVFGSVARLTPAKDHLGLLRAFALVRREHSEARLLLVGDGETRPELERTVAGFGLGEAVHLAGMRADIAEHLRAMDVFVLSSRREGFPMAVLEALACGVPVVSTEVGGIAALNAGEETVRLVPPGDPPALAQAMLETLRDPAARADAAVRGRALVESRYCAARVAERYFSLYHETGGI